MKLMSMVKELAGTVKEILGTCVSIVCTIDGKDLKDLQHEINDGLWVEFSCGYDHALKVRKPYTITKQREKWTDEEHKKFLEALKLYGRAWRKIEVMISSPSKLISIKSKSNSSTYGALNDD
ncbi:hypothetical protein RYX36_010352 [Vicia faba]